MRTRIYCNVAQGDPPLEIKWKKDGKLIEPLNPIASIRTIDQFSVALVIENLSDLHTGNYTCVVRSLSNTVTNPDVNLMGKLGCAERRAEWVDSGKTIKFSNDRVRLATKLFRQA